jgi:N-acetyl-gamma-glutamyl-phosphate reductase
MAFKAGIVGVSGYGGGEVLRYLARHPELDLVYVAGESSAGSTLLSKFPGIEKRLAGRVIEKWDPAALPELDVLFASLPSGESKAALAAVSPDIAIVDIGGDHRFVDGWTYGLADVWPEEMRGKKRIANPGCYPAATLGALAPLLKAGLIDPVGIVVDAKSGVSGAGRGGGSTFGYGETNEDLMAYGFFKHAHLPEMKSALSLIGGKPASLTFTPHLVPMTRGILATCYARAIEPGITTADCLETATTFYKDRPFVRVVEQSPHTKWASGTNLLFVSYFADPATGAIIALGAIDNLGKGAAGQAVQNANLLLGLEESAGLAGHPMWP